MAKEQSSFGLSHLVVSICVCVCVVGSIYMMNHILCLFFSAQRKDYYDISLWSAFSTFILYRLLSSANLWEDLLEAL